jgi:hypothetical protein
MGNETEMLEASGAYALYQKATLAEGNLLGEEVFQAFWNDIGADDRAHWLNQFRRGTTTLSKEVVEDLEATFDALQSGRSEPEPDNKLLGELRQRLACRKLPS